MNNLRRKEKGFGLVEVVVGSAVLSVALFSIANFFQTALSASKNIESVTKGSYFLEEGVEVVKLFRDMSYSSNILNMSTTTPHYYSWNGTSWATTTVNTLIEGRFERKFTLSDVKRDANSDIAVAGTYDPNVKLVTVNVSWLSPIGTTTRSIQTYVLNIFNN